MASIINITRKRDDYTFIFDNGKEAHYNFDTGIKIGVSGKQVKKLDYNSSICHALTNFCSPSRRELCDRLISLPIDYEKKDRAVRKIYYDSDCDFILNRWKMFIKYLETPMEEYFGAWCSLEELKKLLPKITNPDFYRCLYGYTIDTDLIKKYKLLPKELAKIDKEMQNFSAKRKALLNGMTEEDFEKEYCLRFNNPQYSFNNKIIAIINQFGEIDRLVKSLLLDNYEVTNIETDLRDLRSMSDRKESEVFAKFQTEGNLEYENDKYKIIVPKSRKELADYGNFFGNCLNGFEWNTFLSVHTRYAVIVYDKEKKKPVVCTDITVIGRIIQQYLGKHNSSISDSNLQAFRKEYQKFLRQEKGE